MTETLPAKGDKKITLVGSLDFRGNWWLEEREREKKVVSYKNFYHKLTHTYFGG